LTYFHERKPRGEVALIIQGAPEQKTEAPDSDALAAALREELDSGSTSRDAIETVAKRLGLPRKVVYRACLGLTRSGQQSTYRGENS
jgi:16S rRNA (cytidine1402-2'-O)-methyltransferase